MTESFPSDLDSALRGAVAAHQANRLNEARSGYDDVLRMKPDHPWANYFRGLIAENAGEITEAFQYFRNAARSREAPVQALVALGNQELAHGTTGAALVAFDRAIAQRPLFAAAHTGRVLALKRQQRLHEAGAAAEAALRLRRGWRHDAVAVLGQLDPAESEEMRRTNRTKLRHDAAQLRHLLGQGSIGRKHAAIAAVYDSLADELKHLPDDATIVRLDDAALARCGYAYNRLLHLGDGTALAASPLAPATDFAGADRDFSTRRPGPVVIDNVLQPDALNRLRRFMLDSTIWFEVKDHGAHLGAYFEDGLACPLVLQIAVALRQALPDTLGRLSLMQLWAYRHTQGGDGTAPHADIGTISANFWSTPDEANDDPAAGGLEIWPVRVPAHWDFHAMNADRRRVMAFLTQSGTAPIAVPYRCNRLVLFDANLFHRTQPGRFRHGFANQRMNMTFLFEHLAVASGLQSS